VGTRFPGISCAKSQFPRRPPLGRWVNRVHSGRVSGNACFIIVIKDTNTLTMAKYQRIERSYESFLELPVPVVLVVLWLAGVPLVGVVPLSLCAAALYSY